MLTFMPNPGDSTGNISPSQDRDYVPRSRKPVIWCEEMADVQLFTVFQSIQISSTHPGVSIQKHNLTGRGNTDAMCNVAAQIAKRLKGHWLDLRSVRVSLFSCTVSFCCPAHPWDYLAYLFRCKQQIPPHRAGIARRSWLGHLAPITREVCVVCFRTCKEKHS